MPIVTIDTWPLKPEMKPELIKKITKAFTDMHIPVEAVSIVIHESPKENWGSGGEQHSSKFKGFK